MIVKDSEYLDFKSVPQSKGISRQALIIVGIGLVMIFIIGGLTIGMASFGHQWPAEHSMRVDMGTMNH
ncbi:MAG: hypothetical protein M3N13_00550 [Candidatus Eremiobacteraeota bacterium]|nr:hypothetical protein [Candidatus Eremiobacteraeota bacterium]